MIVNQLAFNLTLSEENQLLQLEALHQPTPTAIQSAIAAAYR
jgi:hypothetical protein